MPVDGVNATASRNIQDFGVRNMLIDGDNLDSLNWAVASLNNRMTGDMRDLEGERAYVVNNKVATTDWAYLPLKNLGRTNLVNYKKDDKLVLTMRFYAYGLERVAFTMQDGNATNRTTTEFWCEPTKLGWQTVHITGQAIADFKTTNFLYGYFNRWRETVGDIIGIGWVMLYKDTGQRPEMYCTVPESLGYAGGQPNLVSNSDFTKISNATDLYRGWGNVSGFLKLTYGSDGLTVMCSKDGDRNARFYSNESNIRFEQDVKYTTMVELEMQEGAKFYAGGYSETDTYTAEYTGVHKVVFEHKREGTSTVLSFMFLTANVPYKLLRVKSIKGSKDAMDDWCPTQVDYQGKPNLFNEETVLLGKYPHWVLNTDLSDNVNRWSSDFIPVKEGEVFSFSHYNFYSVNEQHYVFKLYNEAGQGKYILQGSKMSWVAPDGAGRWTDKLKGTLPAIPAGITKMRFGGIQQTSGVSSMTEQRVRHQQFKLIKGTEAELGNWTPYQDKLTNVVPYKPDEYKRTNNETDVVRAETLVIGRGAELEFAFPVVASLEKKYPTLFSGLNVMADKVARLKQVCTSLIVKVKMRGKGLDSKTLAVSERGTLYTRTYPRTSVWGVGYATSANFSLVSRDFYNSAYMNCLSPIDGSLIFIPTSGINSLLTESRNVSDGVTPAWVEVKEIWLEVSVYLPEDPNAQPVTITIPPS